MLRVDIRNAKPDMKLAMKVDHPQNRGHTLLKVGYRLDQPAIGRLKDLGVKSIWADYPNLEFIGEFVDREVLTAQEHVVDDICEGFKLIRRGTVAKVPFDQYKQSIGQLVKSLVENPKAAIFLSDLADQEDDLMRHSGAVTYLSLMMGLKLEGYLVRQRKHITPARAKEVTNLGVGAMLHDIGITQLDEAVRQRFERTGDDSDGEWREHPSIGYQMVRGKIEPSAATIVLNHHQREDGSGYAGAQWPQLEGPRTHIFARIVGVAAEFDRICHPAGDKAATQPTVYALSTILHEQMRRKFDTQVLRALIAVVPPYPPGTIARLSNERWAVCIDHNIAAPCRPVVQIIPDPSSMDSELQLGDTIDLCDEQSSGLHVKSHEGLEVDELNFSLPDLHEHEYAGNAAAFM